jgi:hypothetical protein
LATLVRLSWNFFSLPLEWSYSKEVKVIVLFRQRFLPEQIFPLATGAISIAAVVLSLLWLILLARSSHVEVPQVESRKGTVVQFEIGGPLALKENRRSALALSLEQKLVLLAQSVRPDVKKEERVYRIGVGGSEEQVVVREGEAICCHASMHPSGGVEALQFVEGGEMRMVPRILDPYTLLLEVEKEGVVEEVTLSVTTANGGQAKMTAGVEQLKHAKWWGMDQFFQNYGGEKYRPLGNKQKIELFDRSASHFIYLGVGDYLSFVDGKWTPLAALEEARSDLPLAKVTALSPSEMEVEAWDEKGFPLMRAALRQERSNPARVVIESFLSEPKLRTTQQISCKLGNKRWMLKSGDWLLKTKTGWQKLKTGRDIESYLLHTLRGDLFVIDSVDSKGMVKGRAFDEMRLQMSPFSFQAACSKGRKGGKRK